MVGALAEMRRRATTGGLLLSATYLLVEVATIARVALFAHALTPADMGALVILTTWLRLVEMATDLAIDRYILQARDGLTRRTQAAAHGALILRGFLGSAIMLATAWPLAAFYDLGGSPGAFLVASAVPLLRSFGHLDCRMQNRLMRFWPLAGVEGAAAAVGLGASAIGALVAPGALALSVALLAQALAYVAMSHLLARRDYLFAFEGEKNRLFWRFGWPLLVNALLLYAVFHGERMLVGAALGLDVLGRYGLIAQIALLPALIVGRVSLNLVLPQLSRRGVAGARATRKALTAVLGFAALGVLFWVGFALSAPGAITLLFGRAYLIDFHDLAWIAAAAALRMQKTGPASLLIAAGENRQILIGGALRVAALAPGAAIMWSTGDLTAFVAFAAIGECASHLTMCRALRSTWAVPIWAGMLGPAMVIAPAAFAGVSGDWALSFHVVVGVLSVAVLLVAVRLLWPQTLWLQDRIIPPTRTRI
jgi:O-antigen/teichoic acid export membrane protein